MSSSVASSVVSLTEFFRPRTRGLFRRESRDLHSTRLSILKGEIETVLHLIPLKELYDQLQTDPVNGLSQGRAHELLDYYGPNTLTPPSDNIWLFMLIRSLCSGFSGIIWFGALLCFLAFIIEISENADISLDNVYLGCVLIAIDLACGLYSFYQNYKSTKIMKSFNSLIPRYANCLRDGVLNYETPVHDLVRGDIVFVQAGDVVPADIRIIDSRGFKVDNSSLTGESIAVPRSNNEGNPNILESLNVAFFSTICVEGSATGVVLCCGDLTALGRVAGLAARLSPKPSPLSRELQRFVRYMSVWAISLGIFVAASTVILGYPLMQTTVFVIGIIVANIPEGLQPTVTASLTITARQMIEKHCLVKKLDAMEALGACSIICSDKTGTLTENKMTVQHIWVWNQVFCVKDDNFRRAALYNHAISALKICAALCSNAGFKAGGGMRGDASEVAIFNLLLHRLGNPIAIRAAYPKVAEIPFNSVNKYQVSVHLDSSSSNYIVMMKGAPEQTIVRCNTIVTQKTDIPLTAEMKVEVERIVEQLAATGERVIAFADMVLDSKTFPLDYAFDDDEVNFPIENMRLLGVMCLIDPPRKEVRNAVERVRAAGVRVLMVTGDHPATARAVALEVGIATSPQCCVVTGDHLRNMTPDLLNITLEKHYEIVFARTSPTQKLQIVEACQRQGAVVAVTGDGVNDAPALRRADIGISMGITGSQVSKQTADIILMDDNFASIVTGIEEGRKIFDNLKKSVCYILISNVPEIAPVIMFIVCGIPLPLGVMTILCVDLGTDMWPAVALSYEKAETDVMARPPRVGDSLVSARMLRLVYWHLGLIEFAAGMFAYFYVMAEYGFFPYDLFGIRAQWDDDAISDLKDSIGQEWTYAERKELQQASQAAFFVAIVLTQMTNGIICRTRYNSVFQVGLKNNILNIGILFELLLSCAICYVPGVNTLFRTYPLRLRWWVLALPFCVLMFAFDEFRKYCIRRKLFNGWYNNLTCY